MRGPTPLRSENAYCIINNTNTWGNMADQSCANLDCRHKKIHHPNAGACKDTVIIDNKKHPCKCMRFIPSDDVNLANPE
jgi:hypothetical protein